MAEESRRPLILGRNGLITSGRYLATAVNTRMHSVGNELSSNIPNKSENGNQVK